jgi:hypothetical protein
VGTDVGPAVGTAVGAAVGAGVGVAEGTAVEATAGAVGLKVAKQLLPVMGFVMQPSKQG